MRKQLISILALGLVSGCSTIAGVGADIELLGSGISNLADSAKAQMSEPTARDDCDPYADELAGGDKPACRKMAQGPRGRRY
ncbi:MAG: hypothetical protein AAF613_04105 [Pseudomonadota bacterium]